MAGGLAGLIGPLLGGLTGGGGGGGGAAGGGAGDLLGGLLGGLTGGGVGGGGAAALPGGTGPYRGMATAWNDGQVVADDALRQLAGQGEGPSDNNLIRNIFGTLLGDPGTPPKIVKVPGEAGAAAHMVQPGRAKRPGVLGGLIGGVAQAILGGGMGFVQNHGIESVVAALTAAGASGFTPASILPAIAAFFGSGGAQAIAGTVEMGSRGYRKGGGTAATQVLTHEITGNVGQIGKVLTNGALGQMLGGVNERPAGRMPTGNERAQLEALMGAQAGAPLGPGIGAELGLPGPNLIPGLGPIGGGPAEAEAGAAAAAA